VGPTIAINLVMPTAAAAAKHEFCPKNANAALGANNLTNFRDMILAKPFVLLKTDLEVAQTHLC
jgi:hypothetical protein